MSYRIIDQTEATSIVGTESIIGTQQVSTSETTAKNRRWTFNTIYAWILAKLPILCINYNFDINTGGSDSKLIPAGTAIVGVNFYDEGGVLDGVSNIRIGTTVGGDDIMPDVAIPVDTGSKGQRVALCYSSPNAYTVYISTSYSTITDSQVKVCLETKKIY